jgi:hypothetical protein
MDVMFSVRWADEDEVDYYIAGVKVDKEQWHEKAKEAGWL